MPETTDLIGYIGVALFIPAGGWLLHILVMRVLRFPSEEFSPTHAMITTVLCLAALLPFIGLTQVFPGFAKGARALISTVAWVLVLRWRYPPLSWLAAGIITIVHRAALVAILLLLGLLATKL